MKRDARLSSLVRVDLPDEDDKSRDEHDLGEVPPSVSIPGPLEPFLFLLQFDEGDLFGWEVSSRFRAVAVRREVERERWEEGEEALERAVQECCFVVVSCAKASVMVLVEIR